jgi:hypothetical protein
MERLRGLGNRIGEVFGEFLAKFWPQALAVFGSIGFAAVGLILSGQAQGLGWLFTSFGGLLFLVAAVFTVVGNVALWRTRPKMRELEEQVG